MAATVEQMMLLWLVGACLSFEMLFCAIGRRFRVCLMEFRNTLGVAKRRRLPYWELLLARHTSFIAVAMALGALCLAGALAINRAVLLRTISAELVFWAKWGVEICEVGSVAYVGPGCMLGQFAG